MQATDLQVIKEIPGYKVILKAVLKSQIQQLVEQLADHTGEESVILTASVSDGSLSHLGSESGKVFLEDHDDIKSQFLGFCLKRHHRQKQIEKEKQQQTLSDPGGQMLMAPSTPTRYAQGPRPRFTPTRVHTSPRQFSPQSQSPRGVHPVSLTRASPQSVSRGGASNVRHEPYPGARPRKTALNFDPQSHTRVSKPSSSMRLPTEPGSVQKININPNEVIKIEALDEDEENAEQSKTENKTPSDSGEPGPSTSTESSSPSHTPIPSTPTETAQSPALKDNGSESSSSTVANEPAEVKYSDNLPPEGLSLDSDLSNLTGIPAETPKMDTTESRTSDSGDGTSTSEIDPNVNIKVEAITESELDLEITGVEPGQMAQQDNSQWMPNVQTRMGYGPSTSGAQGDMAGQSSQGYKPKPADGDSSKEILISSEIVCKEGQHFVCPTCGKRFLFKSEMERHIRIHSDSRPFVCQFCGKGFRQKAHLRSHMISHYKTKSTN